MHFIELLYVQCTVIFHDQQNLEDSTNLVRIVTRQERD